MRGSDDELMPYAFKIDSDNDEDEMDLNSPPSSGPEYLKRVMREARNCDAIKVVDKSQHNHFRQIYTSTANSSGRPFYMTTSKGKHPSPTGYAPTPEWQNEQEAEFARMRNKLARYKARLTKIQLKKMRKIMPLKEDSQAWIKFCFGEAEKPFRRPRSDSPTSSREDSEDGQEREEEENKSGNDSGGGNNNKMAEQNGNVKLAEQNDIVKLAERNDIVKKMAERNDIVKKTAKQNGIVTKMAENEVQMHGIKKNKTTDADVEDVIIIEAKDKIFLRTDVDKKMTPGKKNDEEIGDDKITGRLEQMADRNNNNNNDVVDETKSSGNKRDEETGKKEDDVMINITVDSMLSVNKKLITTDQQAVTAHKPLLSYIVALDQPTIIKVLECHIEWLEMTGFTKHQGLWFYALMAGLDKPLEPETCALLRNLARFASIIRATLPDTSDESLTPLNLLICLVAKTFGQADLVDTVVDNVLPNNEAPFISGKGAI